MDRVPGPIRGRARQYWNRGWTAKTEDEVIREFTDAGVEALLVRSISRRRSRRRRSPTSTCTLCGSATPSASSRPWGALEPAKGEVAMAQARKAVRELGLIGFHFHPIMQHFAVNDRRYYPLFELIDELKAAVMIDVGTTGMARHAGGMGRGSGMRIPPPSTISRRIFRT